MNYVQLLDTDINSNAVWDAIFPVLESNNLLEQPQIALTSLSGKDWIEGTGKIADLKYPEKYYSQLHDSLLGTEVEKLIKRYSAFYRWRLLRLAPHTTYSIHKDSLTAHQENIRIHIPLQTNPHSFLCFYDQYPISGNRTSVLHEHLTVNNSYLVNTSGLHTAVNYGKTQRYHIVGIKYENSNNRTQ